MMKDYSGCKPSETLVSAAILVSVVLVLFACAGGKAVVTETKTGIREIPRLIVPTPQEAVYNGKPQPISFYYAGDEDPVLVYYPSAEARAHNSGGSSAAPVQAGIYYVKLSRPKENGYASDEVFLAEYQIHRSPVKIEAAEIQEAIYNGDPKRVAAKSEPPVPLSYSYYPNPELREIAREAAKETVSGGNPSQNLSGAFKGYRRVDRAPIEQGTYYVWIYFPGDENHEACETNVEFTILPPLLN